MDSNQGHAPQRGQVVDEFSLPAVVRGQDGTLGEMVFNSRAHRAGPLVLFFYSKDATPG